MKGSSNTNSHGHSATHPQISILDVFLPGFTNMTGAVHQLLNGNMNVYAYLMCTVAVLAMMRTCTTKIASWLREYLIHVQYSDEAHDMLTSWVASRGLEDAARSSLARVNTVNRAFEDQSSTTKKPLKYSPWEGSFCFWYKHSLLFYRTKQEVIGFQKQEEISVTCLGRSSRILKELLKECRDEYLEHVKHKTTIFGHRGSQWKKEQSKESRPLSTVIISEREKKPLIKDIKDFLEPQTRDWYSKRSIPYRRGYLLHGPPGTGKSSFSLSVAGELDMDIYVVNIPSVDDQALRDLFAELPGKCVVLLEDIDAAGSVHSRKLGAANHNAETESRNDKKSVTLSGVLNVLDGVDSQEDRVLIMTTNHIEKLDEALIRPGRVDRRVEFHLADRDVTTRLYRFVFEQPGETPAEIMAHADDSPEIERQALEFACKVPEWEFSPAQIMSYLLQHRSLPIVALENAEKWVKAMKEAD